MDKYLLLKIINYFREKILKKRYKLIEKSIKTGIYKFNQKRYKKIVLKIKNKIKSGEKINVCFFVMLDSTFTTESIFKVILNDKLFNPFIIVIPDISRGIEHLTTTFEQTYSSLSKKYKNVYKGYNLKTQKYIDLSEKLDIIFFPRPYKGMTSPIYEIGNFLNKEVLPIYISYSFSLTKFSREVLKKENLELYWKIFIPTNEHLKEFEKFQLAKGKNTVITGYPKMDDLFNQKIIKRNKKTIIIAPHHTITKWKLLNISNFLKYSDFFLKLPKLYPNINFIFRPHPLLVVQLKKLKIWGEEKTNNYFKTIESYSNVTYSKGGNYFNIFANSDGIIHDCGSFLAEYLFTNKPACYLLKDKKSIKKWFIPLGQYCIKHCYQAYSQKDIISFIENVIIKNNDPLKNKRTKFVNSELKINYPFASRIILDYIKKEILTI